MISDKPEFVEGIDVQPVPQPDVEDGQEPVPQPGPLTPELIEQMPDLYRLLGDGNSGGGGAAAAVVAIEPVAIPSQAYVMPGEQGAAGPAAGPAADPAPYTPPPIGI